MTTNQDTPPYPNLPQKKQISFWRRLFRLILVILIGTAIAVLLYFGFTRLYQQAVMTINSNANRIDDLENQTDQMSELQENRLTQYNTRISKLENRTGSDAETLSEINADIELLEAHLEAYSDTLDRLDEMDKNFSYLSTQVSGLSAQTPTQVSRFSEADLIALKHSIEMLKAAELINRSRIYMLQNNYGLASQDIENTLKILTGLQKEALQDETLMLNMEVQKLETALSYLPDSPVQASNEIETVWEMLVIGLIDQKASIPIGFPKITATASPTSVLDSYTTATPEIQTETQQSSTATSISQNTPTPAAKPTR